MPLYQRDFDQAARYLRYAAELLERHNSGKTGQLRQTLGEIAQRLSPGETCAGDAAAEIELLRTAAAQLKTINPYVSEARTRF